MKSQTNSKIKYSRSPLKPSLLAGVYYLVIVNLLFSCSTLKIPGKKTETLSTGPYKEMGTVDYADHLASLKNSFLITPGIKTVKLSKAAQHYVADVSQRIIQMNEIFFKNLKKINITILDMESPLHFSLPKGEIFISKGLMAKYIKHESMLVSILAYELVRSENLLYPKLTIVPVGYIPLERMLALNRLGLEEKMEIHKWAHDITVRSGYDGEYYLSWLQTQNRNTADFILQVGDANLISREESLFKAFLIKNTDEDEMPGKKNSSKNFYTFMNSIRDLN